MNAEEGTRTERAVVAPKAELPAPPRWGRRAWIATALFPVGLLVGLVVAYLVAWAIGVTMEPAQGHAPLAKRAIIVVAAAPFWVGPPVVAIVAGVRALRTGRRSVVVALILSGLFLVYSLVSIWDALAARGNMM